MSDVMSVALASIIIFLSINNFILFYLCIKRNRRLTDSLIKFLDSHTKLMKTLGGIIYEEEK